MDRTISAAEANRSFSRLLREVREGQSFTVTSHGRAVARIVPCSGDEEPAGETWAEFLDYLAAKPAAETPLPRWTRDELYECN